MKTTLTLLLSALITLTATYPLFSQTPSQIHYQGLLADEQGKPVNGNRNIAIKLFHVANGGNATYEENIGAVAITNGIYSFAFGAVGNGIAPALTSSEIYLAVFVNGTEQAPRTKILAVPFALKSADAQLLSANVTTLGASQTTLAGNVTLLQSQSATFSSNLTAVNASLASLSANLTGLKNQIESSGGGATGNYATSCTVSTLAGSGVYGSADRAGNEASFYGPSGVAVDSSGNVYVADSENNKIRKITPAGVVTTLAGSGVSGSDDGTGIAASFNYPQGVALDSSGNVYVADTGSHKIRKITPAGVVTTLAGGGGREWNWNGLGSADGTGTTASFNYPNGVAVDSSGNAYIADSSNNKIRKITPEGVVTTLAGSGVSGSDDGTGLAASFNRPEGVAVDKSGNVYVADFNNNKIRKITPAGVVTTLAGSGRQSSRDGTAASFKWPNGVAVDSSGDLYVADYGNRKIRKITPAGVVSTLAGSGVEGSEDGTGTEASFAYADGVAVDSSGNVYVADSGNNLIRKITISP
jgi:serine/threonine protein kinase, bacterial